MTMYSVYRPEGGGVHVLFEICQLDYPMHYEFVDLKMTLYKQLKYTLDLVAYT